MTGRNFPDDDSASNKPTGTRIVVLVVLCLLSAVLYLDRICISQALESIQQDLDLSNTEASYVLMAFTLAYGLFEVPTGRWGDRYGARRVLTRISLWWSAFTALTGACTSLWTLIPVRFLFGAGEAGAFPNIARVMSRWFPEAERGRAQGVLLAASSIGGALAPWLSAKLIGTIGWRWTFVVFGALGAVWAAGFWWWFRDDPREHPSVNEAEAVHIGRGASAGSTHGPIPWAAVARNPSVWFLGAIMACASFNSYIYFSWYPKYLINARGIDMDTAGSMASLVLACSAVGTLAGGQILDRLVLAGELARRRMMGAIAYFAAAGLLALSLRMSNPWVAAFLAGMSCFCTQMTLPLWWSCTIGISGKHVGALFGLMNSVGVFGALSSQYFAGWIADLLGANGYTGRRQWDPIFQIDIGVLAFAGLVWAALRLVEVEGARDEREE